MKTIAAVQPIAPKNGYNVLAIVMDDNLEPAKLMNFDVFMTPSSMGGAGGN